MIKSLKSIIKLVIFVVVLLVFISCNKAASANVSLETTNVTVDKENKSSSKTIYFAAPLFSDAEKEFNLKFAKVFEDCGYKVFLPQRDTGLVADLDGKPEKEKAHIIFESDVKGLMESDILVMVLDGRVPDEGACVELGIAYANKKRCYGIKTDVRSLRKDLDINPMLSECFIKIFKDSDGDSLIKTLKEYLSKNDL